MAPKKHVLQSLARHDEPPMRPTPAAPMQPPPGHVLAKRKYRPLGNMKPIQPKKPPSIRDWARGREPQVKELQRQIANLQKEHEQIVQRQQQQQQPRRRRPQQQQQLQQKQQQQRKPQQQQQPQQHQKSNPSSASTVIGALPKPQARFLARTAPSPKPKLRGPKPVGRPVRKALCKADPPQQTFIPPKAFAHKHFDGPPLKKQKTILPLPVKVERNATASPARIPPGQQRPQQVWGHRPAQGSLQTTATPMLARSAKSAEGLAPPGLVIPKWQPTSREAMKPPGLAIPKGLATSWMKEPKPPGQVTTQAKSAASGPKPPSIKPPAQLMSKAAKDPWMLLGMSEQGEAAPMEVTEEPRQECEEEWEKVELKQEQYELQEEEMEEGEEGDEEEEGNCEWEEAEEEQGDEIEMQEGDNEIEGDATCEGEDWQEEEEEEEEEGEAQEEAAEEAEEEVGEEAEEEAAEDAGEEEVEDAEDAEEEVDEEVNEEVDEEVDEEKQEDPDDFCLLRDKLEQSLGSLERTWEKLTNGTTHLKKEHLSLEKVAALLPQKELEDIGFTEAIQEELLFAQALQECKAKSEAYVTMSEFLKSPAPTDKATVELRASNQRHSSPPVEASLEGEAVVTTCPMNKCELSLRVFASLNNTVTMEVSGGTKALFLKADTPKLFTKCPRCLDGVHVQMRWRHSQIVKAAPRTKQPATGKMSAYVSVLWTNKADPESCNGPILDALTLGHSLWKTATKHFRILLVTQDVMLHPWVPLLQIFWTIRQVEHVEVHEGLVQKCKSKFERAFTKLRAWELEEFPKVVLLDTDLLVRRNVDELFDLPTPTAYMRGHQEHFPAFRKPEEHFYDKRSGKQKYGINAGVIVLEPSKKVAQEMFEHLRSPDVVHNGTTGPEQDFLSAWFLQEWQAGLLQKYNYQLHQLLFLQGRESDRLHLRAEDVAIYHFSSEFKPSAYMLQKGIPDFPSFLTEMVENFDRSSKSWGSNSSKDREVALDRIKYAMQEWQANLTEMWEGLIAHVTSLAAGEKATTCSACGDTITGQTQARMQHILLECSEVQTQKQEWMEATQLAYPSLADLTRARVPGKLAPSMTFLAEVHRVRRQEMGAPAWSGAKLDSMVPTEGGYRHRPRWVRPPQQARMGTSTGSSSCTDLVLADAPSGCLPSMVREAPEHMREQLGKYLHGEGLLSDEQLEELEEDEVSLLIDKAKSVLPIGHWSHFKKALKKSFPGISVLWSNTLPLQAGSSSNMLPQALTAGTAGSPSNMLPQALTAGTAGSSSAWSPGLIPQPVAAGVSGDYAPELTPVGAEMVGRISRPRGNVTAASLPPRCASEATRLTAPGGKAKPGLMMALENGTGPR